MSMICVNAQSDTDIIEAPTTKIEFEETTFQWGELIEGEKIQNVFTFTNTGFEPLVILNAKGSCGCTVPRWPKEPIMPGETADLLVEFNSANKGKIGGNPQSKRVTITANTEPANTYLTIKGTVIKPETTEQKKSSKDHVTSLDIKSDQVSIFPNPAQGQISVRFSDFENTSGLIEIYNGQGLKVSAQKLSDLTQDLKIDTSNYEAGTYTVSIKVEGKNRIAKRFVVLGS